LRLQLRRREADGEQGPTTALGPCAVRALHY
jgi:hypothetical protein